MGSEVYPDLGVTNVMGKLPPKSNGERQVEQMRGVDVYVLTGERRKPASRLICMKETGLFS